MTSPGAAGRPVGAIDCGTNSTRLLVADGSGATLVRRMTITRLGQGVAATGRLAPEAIGRTVDVLRSYRGDLDEHGVDRVRMTATSAARDAANRDEFFGPAQGAIGAPVELLSGEDEGRLSFVGATTGLDPEIGPLLVCDIGGGSTELIAGPGPATPGTAPELRGVRSLHVGCVRATETFLAGDPPSPGEIAEARSAVRTLLDEAVTDVPAFAEPATLVGLAGSVSALTRLDQDLAAYDHDRIHHAWLRRSSVEALLSSLAGETVEERRSRPAMEDARAETIVGGAIVLAEVMDRFDVDRCLVSESDILDGLAMSLLRLAGG